MNCAGFSESADALALGALEPEEASAARGHLAACASCASDYALAAAVSERLPLSVPLVRAPAGLRAAVFDAIGAGSAAPEPAASATAGPSPVAPAPLRPRAAPRYRSLAARGLLPWLAAAAMLAVSIVLGVWVASLQSRIGRLEHSRGTNAAALAAQTQHDAILLLSSPNTVSAKLWAKPANPGAVGAIIWNPSHQRCVVVADQLKPLEDGREYHVWFSAGGNRWDGGKIVADPQGAAEANFSTDRWQLGVGYTVTIVAQSAAGGATSEPVLEGTVQATAQ